jgi:D-amino-acid dehydrogenase
MAVIGAGIVGVTTAFELAADGHAVTVFERRGSVAAEIQLRQCRGVAPGYVTPWAAPGMPCQGAVSCSGATRRCVSAASVRWPLLPWMWRWWRACSRRCTAATGRHAGPGALQPQRLQTLAASLQLDFEQAQGYWCCCARRRVRWHCQARRPEAAGRTGCHISSWWTPTAARRSSRAEHRTPPWPAAIHLPQDGVGQLPAVRPPVEGRGAAPGRGFRFEHDVQRVRPARRPRIEWRHGGVAASAEFDAVIVCAGVQANAVLRGAGLSLPLAAGARLFHHGTAAALRRPMRRSVRARR